MTQPTKCGKCGREISEFKERTIAYLMEKAQSFRNAGLFKEAEDFEKQARSIKDFGTNHHYNLFPSDKICSCTSPLPQDEKVKA